MCPSIPGVTVRLADRPRFLFQRFTHIPCTSQVRLALSERASFGVGEVRGLRENQELVEGIYTQAGDQFQPYGQPYATQVVHRLIEREAAGIAQSSVRAPEFVFDNIPRITKQDSSRLFLSLNHVPDDSQQLIEQFLFRASQRRLVGDLEVIPDDFTPLAVQAAIRQSHLL